MKDQAVQPSRSPRISVFLGLLAFLILSTSSIGLAALPVVTVGQGSDQGSKISPWLAGRLETSAAPQQMIIVLDTEPDLGAAAAIEGRPRRRGFVYDALRGAALSSQSSLAAWLKGRGIEVEQQFWIVNAVLIRGDLDLARSLAALPGVERIVGNPVLKGLPAEPATFGASIQSCPGEDPFGYPGLSPWAPTGVETGAVTGRGPVAAGGALLGAGPFEGWGSTAQGAFSPGSVETIEYGVAMVNADDVWSIKGVRGEGIVVASMDTGVDWTHPAIQSKYRGWNGGSPDHSYSWHDPVGHTTTPLDDYGHGTHTVGTMVGDDGVGNQVGVAPGARWIGCRNMDHGNGTPALYLECMQWGLAPWPEGSDPMVDGRPDLGADITNNSWTCPPSEGCSALTLLSGFEHLRAAGQLTVAAAGNAGSACSSLRDPPAIYDAVFSVGAVNSARSLASFSSRGPVTIDGSNRLKPNVSAPGVSVRSSVPGTGYGTSSGTSMASPHATGVMALLWSAKPELKRLIRISRCYLQASAGPGAGTVATCGGTPPASRPNNMFGWGIIDALAAIDLGPDSDHDGIADPCDCDPADGGAFEEPTELGGDRFAAEGKTYSWDSVAEATGQGIVYVVGRGLASQLRIDGGFASALCASDGQSSPFIVDPQAPPPGEAFYYLARAQNVCGEGSWGAASNGTPREIAGCR